MKFNFGLLCILEGALLCPVCLNAQSVQPVQVVEYNQTNPKSPLGGVRVSVVNAAAAMSDAEGNLSLSFRTYKPGDRVEVRGIEKYGYEVFNQAAVEQWAISPSTPFRLVLCKSEHVAALRAHYMQLASANYQKQFELEVKELQAMAQKQKVAEAQFQMQMEQLKEQFNQQLSQLSNYVDQFVHIDLSELSEQQAYLVQLVNEGRMEEAIRAYEEADYPAQLTREINDIQKIDRDQKLLADERKKHESNRQSLFQAIQRQSYTYMMAGGRQNYLKAQRLLKAAADADTTYVEALEYYVSFASRQLMVDEASYYVDIAARQLSDSPEWLMTQYLTLSGACGVVHQFDKMDVYHAKAMAVGRPLIQNGTAGDGVRELYAILLYSIANKQLYMSDKAAIQTTADAEAMMRPLYVGEATQRRIYYMASILVNKSNCVMGTTQDPKKVREVLDEAKSIIEPYKDESSMHELYVKMMNNYLEVVESPDDAVRICEEVYQLESKEYRNNPDAGMNKFLVAVFNIAQTYVECGRFDLVDEKLTLAEELHQTIESRFGRPFFEQQFYLAYLKAIYSQAKGEKDQMKQFVQEAMDCLSKMPEEMQFGFQLQVEDLKKMQQ